MSEEEAVKRMAELVKMGVGDPEMAHSFADEVLIAFLRGLGYGELCDEWEKVKKWYA